MSTNHKSMQLFFASALPKAPARVIAVVPSDESIKACGHDVREQNYRDDVVRNIVKLNGENVEILSTYSPMRLDQPSRPINKNDDEENTLIVLAGHGYIGKDEEVGHMLGIRPQAWCDWATNLAASGARFDTIILSTCNSMEYSPLFLDLLRPSGVVICHPAFSFNTTTIWLSKSPLIKQHIVECLCQRLNEEDRLYRGSNITLMQVKGAAEGGVVLSYTMPRAPSDYELSPDRHLMVRDPTPLEDQQEYLRVKNIERVRRSHTAEVIITTISQQQDNLRQFAEPAAEMQKSIVQAMSAAAL